MMDDSDFDTFKHKLDENTEWKNGHRHCVNPAGLRIGTPAENQQDRIRDGTDCRGEKAPNAKLTEVQVREIMSLRIIPQEARAKMFNVSRGAIKDIDLGKTWKHLSPQVVPS